MKNILISVLLSLSLFGANIDEYAKSEGFERDYKTALTKAKNANKPLMMVLGADYCPWCRKFERKTLSSKDVKSFLNKELITLVVDKKFDIESFPAKFQTNVTPRVFFINPKTEEDFFQTAGYIKKKDYLKKLDEMKKLYKGE
ncbi:thioredoxin family protein [Sulfurimonas lithotrophica]|uniref:Thioredoxin family protein n=1 Tax=Sulfurimonas lithotrophica TaxID=2590022 RepID=A0A5P8P3Q3_9BACT|nr:thioredoxin family protein [Sulfurimonas lithotrophica]QFR50378.1 thioredoxin family protein [Sulfurimonas lithotrophica]